MASKKHEAIRARQIKQAQAYYNHKPSNKSDRSAWIYALRQREQETYPQDSKKSGKWLIFPAIENVNEIWEKIKRAVENGFLGNKAKVASANNTRINKYTGKECQVICVYTYDWTDKEDVIRVREELRKLGISEEIGYKTDADTMAGKYHHKGYKNICKYRI